MEDYYRILGVESGASQETIRKAWLDMAHRHHPDHNGGDQVSNDLFISIREAYRVLSSPELRGSYDKSLNPDQYKSNAKSYFKVNIDQCSVGVLSEIRLNYSYIGNGKLFQRPAFEGFRMATRPYVSHRMVSFDGGLIKETTLTFVIVPLMPGVLKIDAASIMVSGERLFSEQVQIAAFPVQCAFLKNAMAGGKPLDFHLSRTIPAKRGRFPIGESKANHVVMVPRSKAARVFHELGISMKVIFTLWGCFMWANHISSYIFFGAIIGNLVGGINVRLMYYLAGVKSSFSGGKQTSLVREYLEHGYVEGRGLLWPLDKSGVFDKIMKAIL
ncbi:MAG: DnaJ domain-containing protein [Arcticibacter sp.]